MFSSAVFKILSLLSLQAELTFTDAAYWSLSPSLSLLLRCGDGVCGQKGEGGPFAQTMLTAFQHLR